MKGLRHSKGNEPMTCPACNEHVAASAFCDDCDSWLCTQCVLAHWRVRLTKMHRINLQECTACAEGCLVKAFCVDCDQWLCEQCILAHQRVLLTKKHRLQSNDEDLFMPGTPTPQAKTVNHDQPHESSSCNEIRHFSKVATAMDSNWNNCLGARSGANFSTNASTEQGKYATLSDGTTGGSMGKTIEASAGVIEEDSEQQDDSESQLNSSGDEQTNDRNDDVCAVCGDGGDLVCCDGCTKAFHEACHIPVITSLPNDTWHCGLCTKEEDVRLEAPEMNREPLSEPSGATKRKATTGLTEGELKVCEVLLLQMLCHDDCNPFFVHVPESETEYHKKIKNPMDFSKIRPKLEKREYENINAFLQDIRLIFNNCIKYNKPKSEQWRSGRQLKTFFKKRISHLLPFVDYTDIPLGLVDTTGKLPKLQKLSSDDSGLSGNEASSETSKESTRPSSGKPGTSSMISPLNTSESNSAVSVLSPNKQALYPKKHGLSTKKQELSTKKQGLSTKKQELSTKKQELSTKKQELSPKKQKFSPKKQELCPKKQELSTKMQELSPQKKPMSPTNQPGPSSEKQGSSSKKTSVSLETKGPSSETLMVSSEKPVLFTDRTIEQTNSNAQSPPWIIEEY